MGIYLSLKSINYTMLYFQMETDPRLNWHSYLDSHALISGQLNSLLKSVKTPER